MSGTPLQSTTGIRVCSAYSSSSSRLHLGRADENSLQKSRCYGRAGVCTWHCAVCACVRAPHFEPDWWRHSPAASIPASTGGQVTGLKRSSAPARGVLWRRIRIRICGLRLRLGPARRCVRTQAHSHARLPFVPLRTASRAAAAAGPRDAPLLAPATRGKRRRSQRRHLLRDSVPDAHVDYADRPSQWRAPLNSIQVNSIRLDSVWHTDYQIGPNA